MFLNRSGIKIYLSPLYYLPWMLLNSKDGVTLLLKLNFGLWPYSWPDVCIPVCVCVHVAGTHVCVCRCGCVPSSRYSQMKLFKRTKQFSHREGNPKGLICQPWWRLASGAGKGPGGKVDLDEETAYGRGDPVTREEQPGTSTWAFCTAT